MNVFVVPIEPIETRYTEQWRRWFESQWPNAIFIDGEQLTHEIEEGSFLDVYGTHYYKASQVMRITKMLRAGVITHGDVLFFLDIWFPLEQIFYMLDCAHLDVKVAGMLHAGTYDHNDFLYASGMTPWASHVETGWFHRVDKLFVCSKYHKNLVCQNRHVSPDKVDVVGFPFLFGELDAAKKSVSGVGGKPNAMYQVVFPHRMVPEKGLEVLAAFEQAGIIVTKPECRLSKKAYYRMLAESKYVLSWARQETFGISTMEATYLGCMPLLPNRLSYPELYHESAIFGSIEEMIKTVKNGGKTSTDGPHSACMSAFVNIEDTLMDLTHGHRTYKRMGSR